MYEVEWITVSEKKNISTIGRTTWICDQTNTGESGTLYGELTTYLIESRFLSLSTPISPAYNFGNKRTCRQGSGPRYTLSALRINYGYLEYVFLGLNSDDNK